MLSYRELCGCGTTSNCKGPMRTLLILPRLPAVGRGVIS